MSDDITNNKSENTEASPPVLKSSEAEVRAETFKWASAEYDRLMNQVDSYLKVMSARQMRRAIKNALLFQIKDDKMTYGGSLTKGKVEAVAGGVLAKAMDVRIVLMGNKLLQQEEGENKDVSEVE